MLTHEEIVAFSHDVSLELQELFDEDSDQISALDWLINATPEIEMIEENDIEAITELKTLKKIKSFVSVWRDFNIEKIYMDIDTFSKCEIAIQGIYAYSNYPTNDDELHEQIKKLAIENASSQVVEFLVDQYCELSDSLREVSRETSEAKIVEYCNFIATTVVGFNNIFHVISGCNFWHFVNIYVMQYSSVKPIITLIQQHGIRMAGVISTDLREIQHFLNNFPNQAR